MFTGIITAQGRIESVVDHGVDRRLAISVPPAWLQGAAEGDSIAVNGVCLTALSPGSGQFEADVSRETLDCTTLGEFAPGRRVNLEQSLRAQDRLGGHLVSGHVDGRATLLTRVPEGQAERFHFDAPPELARYIAAKGSVCVDGISLTVNAVDGSEFGVCIIPHTLAVTTLGQLAPGDAINLEVDTVARYLERLAMGAIGGQTT